MRRLDTESLIGCGWKQWSGCQDMSIDPYQGRSQAENQWVPRLAFRPVSNFRFEVLSKATAAVLLAKPSIDPQTKTGLRKKQCATVSSCQPHIGLKP